MNDKMRVAQLKVVLQALVDEYVQYVDNACHCDDEFECPYCVAIDVLKLFKN
jgi:hypothetical protein